MGQTMSLVAALQKNHITGVLVNRAEEQGVPPWALMNDNSDSDTPWGLIHPSGRREMISVYSPLTDSFIPAAQAVKLGLLSEVRCEMSTYYTWFGQKG